MTSQITYSPIWPHTCRPLFHDYLHSEGHADRISHSSLLALFGERVTTQFMSQSMGWADSIILAMAPLGVVTAVVAAIRVGGPA